MGSKMVGENPKFLAFLPDAAQLTLLASHTVRMRVKSKGYLLHEYTPE